MKTKIIRKDNVIDYLSQTVNTDDLISDFEFMYRMLRLQLKLDIDEAASQPVNIEVK